MSVVQVLHACDNVWEDYISRHGITGYVVLCWFKSLIECAQLLFKMLY